MLTREREIAVLETLSKNDDDDNDNDILTTQDRNKYTKSETTHS